MSSRSYSQPANCTSGPGAFSGRRRTAGPRSVNAALLSRLSRRPAVPTVSPFHRPPSRRLPVARPGTKPLSCCATPSYSEHGGLVGGGKRPDQYQIAPGEATRTDYMWTADADKVDLKNEQASRTGKRAKGRQMIPPAVPNPEVERLPRRSWSGRSIFTRERPRRSPRSSSSGAWCSPTDTHAGMADRLGPECVEDRALAEGHHDLAHCGPARPDWDDNGEFAWFMDPDGNKVELWEPRAREETNGA